MLSQVISQDFQDQNGLVVDLSRTLVTIQSARGFFCYGSVWHLPSFQEGFPPHLTYIVEDTGSGLEVGNVPQPEFKVDP